MKSTRPILAICMMVLSACGPSAEAIQEAIVQTQAAALPTPTSEPTKIPLDSIDLEELLILPGDLPTNFEGQQIRSELPEALTKIGITKGINTVSQGFKVSEWGSDGVTITVYRTAQEAKDIFVEKLNTDLPKVEGLGDLSIVSEGGTLCEGCSIQVLFVRCNALVYVDIFNQMATRDYVYETITTYAKRLDERLQPLVCE